MSELIEPGHERRDMRKIEAAIKQGWEIPEVLLQKLAGQMGAIVQNGTSKEKIAAARVLVAMHASNLRQQIVQHQHVHAVLPTPSVTGIDDKRQEAARILARLR